jgi:hypothetical protein
MTQTSDRSKFVSHTLHERWGETDHVLEYDQQKAVKPVFLPLFHVRVWDASPKTPITIWNTSGASDLQMPHADFRVENNRE